MTFRARQDKGGGMLSKTEKVGRQHSPRDREGNNVTAFQGRWQTLGGLMCGSKEAR